MDNDPVDVAVDNSDPEVQEVTKSEHDQIGYLTRQLKKAEKIIEDNRRAQMSETDRLSLERDEAITRAALAEERITSMLLSTKFEAEARKAGIHDELIDLAFQAADRDILHIDDQGKVKGVKQAIERLQKERPALFGLQQQRQPRVGGGNPPGGIGGGSTSSRVNAWIRSQL